MGHWGVIKCNKVTNVISLCIEITKYIYLTLTLYFNSHTLLHSSHASIQLSTGHLPDHICFFVMLALNCSRIHLSHSFFLLPWNISDHTTPLLYSYSRHTHLSIQTSCIFTHLWQPLPQKRPLRSLAGTKWHISVRFDRWLSHVQCPCQVFRSLRLSGEFSKSEKEEKDISIQCGPKIISYWNRIRNYFVINCLKLFLTFKL